MKKQDVAGHGARRRARGLTYADGDVNSLNGSLTDHARTRDARRRPFTEAEVAAWRKRIFAETMDDPVKVAVEEAVKSFGSSDDFTIWAWYANQRAVAVNCDPPRVGRYFSCRLSLGFGPKTQRPFLVGPS